MDDPKDTQGATTSEETKGTSTEPKTFTEEQVTASNQKAVSDALSAAGRTAKAHGLPRHRFFLGFSNTVV